MTYVLWRILYIANLDLTDLRVSRSLANDYIHVCHSLGMWLFFLFQPQCLFQGKGGGGGGKFHMPKFRGEQYIQK